MEGQASQTLAIADQSSAPPPRPDRPAAAAESPAGQRTEERDRSARGNDRQRDPSPRDAGGRRVRPVTTTFNDSRGGSLVIPPGQGYRQSENRDRPRNDDRRDDRRDRSRSLERKGKGKSKGKGRKKGK